MISKPLVAAFLAAGCLGAAAGGAFFAVRQNASDAARSAFEPVADPSAAAAAKPKPVSETEALIEPPPAAPATPPQPEAEPSAAPPARVKATPESRPARPQRAVARARDAASSRETARSLPTPTTEPAPQVDATASTRPVRTEVLPPVAPIVDPLPAPREPEFVQVVVPASSVIGLHVESTLSSERARLEDTIEARVTRDVRVDDRIAIPAGSRAIGSVIAVERGGKMKTRARLGVRFHTLVFADGTEVPIRTEAIFREGESPGSESAKKIGGATVGGAILGAIIGGGKGAAIGGAAGAAGGSAVVMAGDRNAATLTAGTIVTVRLTDPVAVDVLRRD